MNGVHAGEAAPPPIQETPPGLPHPPYPYRALACGLGGEVVIRLTFDADGNVQDCRVIHSNADPILQQNTVNFFKGQVHSEALAGKTFQFPVTYVLPDPQPDLPAPANFLAPGDPERKLKLSLTFGPDGRIKAGEVSQTSGSATFDLKVLKWVKIHWHHLDYANKTLVAPFDFKPVPVTK